MAAAELIRVSGAGLSESLCVTSPCVSPAR